MKMETRILNACYAPAVCTDTSDYHTRLGQTCSRFADEETEASRREVTNQWQRWDVNQKRDSALPLRVQTFTEHLTMCQGLFEGFSRF